MRCAQTIAQPVLFADLYIPISLCAPLLDYVFAHTCRGSNPGVHTTRLRVYENHYDRDESSALMALMLYMPNLRSFVTRHRKSSLPQLLTLCQHGRHTLQTLEIYIDISDAPNVLAAVENFTALRALCIEQAWDYHQQTAGLLDACAPLLLPHLVRFEANLHVRLLPDLARWLARCTKCMLPALKYFALTASDPVGDEHDLDGLAAFGPFFAVHEKLHSLSISACKAVTFAILTAQLPPGLRCIALCGPSTLSWALTSALPALPPAVRRLTIRADPQSSELWHLLGHLLREHTLSVTEIAIVFEEMVTNLPEFLRSFSWSTLLLPPGGIHQLDGNDARICGDMMMYALEFKKRGVSIVDEHGCVWPPRGETGQRDTPTP
jgi:hypothetical protein